MTMHDIERHIIVEARDIFNNKKLRIKDLLEWNTGEIEPHEGEVVEFMPIIGVYVAIDRQNDKRKPTA